MHGYTLSLDFTKCVNVTNCSAGQTVLAILLTLVYWIVIVALVFTIMYYKVGIGYLYVTVRAKTSIVCTSDFGYSMVHKIF